MAFLDADSLPMAEWLNGASKYMEEPRVGLFGSTPLCPDDGTWVEKAWFSTSPKGAYDGGFICSANMLIKKDVFIQVNGLKKNQDMLF